MVRTDLHIINKQVCEFECLHSEHAFQMQYKSDRLLLEKITNSINRICNQLSAKDEVINIPLLELDLGKISFERFHENFIPAFEKGFFEELLEWKSRNAERHRDVVSTTDSLFKILKSFLLTGKLPWFAGKRDKNYLFDLLVEILGSQPEQARRLIMLNLDQKNFIERLINVLDVESADRVISLIDSNGMVVSEIENEIVEILNAILTIDPGQADYTNENDVGLIDFKKEITEFENTAILLRQLLQSTDKMSRDHIHKIAIEFSLKLISSKTEFFTAEQLFVHLARMIAMKFEIGDIILKNILLQFNPERTRLFKIVTNEIEIIKKTAINYSEDPVEEDEKEDKLKFYISNAGLVLLAGYLPAFFSELQLLDDGRFINNRSQIKAVFLLHYLCTGEQSGPEYILPLNKILCGISLEQPLPYFVSLTDKEKSECDTLLTEIISNWQKLGDTSADALRESFLNRDGILSQEDSGWKLAVERTGYDVLLDSMPWSFKHIKLNWMETLITTEW